MKYFKANDVVQWRCQYNWLIVLTDGADTENSDPVEAVRRLYHEYIRSSEDDGRGLPVRTLVIGLIDPEKMTGLADTLESMADLGGRRSAKPTWRPWPGFSDRYRSDPTAGEYSRSSRPPDDRRSAHGQPARRGRRLVHLRGLLPPQNEAQWKAPFQPPWA